MNYLHLNFKIMVIIIGLRFKKMKVKELQSKNKLKMSTKKYQKKGNRQKLKWIIMNKIYKVIKCKI